MATFFVGQRVRLVWKSVHSNTARKVGAEGRVAVVGPWRKGEINFRNKVMTTNSDYLVDWSDGDDSFVLSSQIEPILPDGHRAGDYSLSELLDRCRAGEGVPA